MKKDNVFVLLAILTILILSVFIVYIDRIFPAPDMPDFEMPSSGNYSAGSKEAGTNPNASVTIEEFSDFQCPFCSNAAETVNQIMITYGNEVNFVFRHFPAHQDSLNAAEAAECAKDQGKFWQFHDVMFQNQYSLDVSSLKRYADELGLDTAKFNSCLDSDEKLATIRNDMNEAQARNVQGTPTFFINGNPVVGAQPFSVFQAAIEDELSK